MNHNGRKKRKNATKSNTTKPRKEPRVKAKAKKKDLRAWIDEISSDDEETMMQPRPIVKGSNRRTVNKKGARPNKKKKANEDGREPIVPPRPVMKHSNPTEEQKKEHQDEYGYFAQQKRLRVEWKIKRIGFDSVLPAPDKEDQASSSEDRHIGQ